MLRWAPGFFGRRVDRRGAGFWRGRSYCCGYRPIHFLSQFICYLFLILFAVSLLAHFLRGNRL